MADYKLTVTTGLRASDTQLIADAVFEDHGDDFDANRGDFSIIAEDRQFTVTIKDVADGDVRSLADQILEKHGDLDFSASKNEGDSWFPFDLEDEWP